MSDIVWPFEETALAARALAKGGLAAGVGQVAAREEPWSPS